MTKPVVILGCGPSGLLAAHACALRGVEFKILSRPERSVLHGSQYLHKPIEGLVNENDGRPVKYVNYGSPEQYRRKVHGKWWDGMVMPEEFETDHIAWDIRVAYHRLWDRYSEYIEPVDLVGDEVEPRESFGWAAAVISTVPRTVWKRRGDEFIYSRSGFLADSPTNKMASSLMHGMQDNRIICDGRSHIAWTRASKVFGFSTIEWPDQETPPVPEAVRVIKPLRCVTKDVEGWHFIGRYGEWRKGVVVSDAWDQANKILEGL